MFCVFFILNYVGRIGVFRVLAVSFMYLLKLLPVCWWQTFPRLWRLFYAIAWAGHLVLTEQCGGLAFSSPSVYTIISRAETLLKNEIQYTPSDAKNLEIINGGEMEGSVIMTKHIFCGNICIYMISNFISRNWMKYCTRKETVTNIRTY
jgi:hypothetical protein